MKWMDIEIIILTCSDDVFISKKDYVYHIFIK